MRFVVTFALLTGAAFGATLTDPDPSQIDSIIAKFAAKEAAFAKARSNFTTRGAFPQWVTSSSRPRKSL